MIRKLEPKDIPKVMQIWLEGNIQAHPFVPKDHWLSHYASVEEQLMQADVFVYEKDQAIQGFVGMSDNYLAGIFVEKNCRSMGIGKTLLEYIKKSYPTFSLHVYEKNKRALNFYLREGGRIISNEVDHDTGEAEYFIAWNFPCME